MKNDIVSYELGSFIDFKGNERMVIACAVSQSVNNTDKTQFTANWSNHDTDPILIVRVISIGIAVYNSEDEFDIEQGKTIAYNRALYNNPSICCPFIVSRIDYIEMANIFMEKKEKQSTFVNSLS